MHVNFTFSGDNLAPVNFNTNVIEATPLELLIDVSEEKHRLRKQEALRLYARALDLLFSGVSNYASGKITGVKVGKSWFGEMEKNRDVINWSALFDKNYVVVYDLRINSLTENMYIADAIRDSASGGEGEFSGVEPVYLESLLRPNVANLKDKIIKAISVTTEFVSGYKLVWEYNGVEGLSVVNKFGRVVGVDDITDDETYILVKLLTLIMSKGNHLGVFIIDARGFSDAILEAFMKTAEYFYGDAFIFMYNVNPASKLKREQVLLPNFLHY